MGYVIYKDQAGNTSTVFGKSITLDTVAPTITVNGPAASLSDSFIITWTGTDATSGILHYDVQYRVGRGGAWTDWLSGVTSISATFGPLLPVSVTRGQTYYFRVGRGIKQVI